MTDFETLLLQRLEQIDRKIDARGDNAERKIDVLDAKVDRGLAHAHSKIAHNTAKVERLDERSKRGRWALYVSGSVLGILGALYAILGGTP
jgi:hypothetical protein